MDNFNTNLAFFIGLLAREDITDEKKKSLMVGEGEERFYLVKTAVLGDQSGEKSMLQYIVDNGPRMMKQREDLLDFLAKRVERFDSEGKPLDQKQIEMKIINNLKLGLPSSTGLAQCIKMTEEKFPWGKMKARAMIAFSIVANLLSLALYFVDVTTDCQFVGEMSNNSQHFSDFKFSKIKCTDNFYRKIDEKSPFCKREEDNIKGCIDFHENKVQMGQKCLEIGPRFEDPDQFTECFWYSLIHCIAPIIWTLLAFAQTMTTTRLSMSSIKKIPFQPITRFVKIYQDIQKYTMRTRDDFAKKVAEIEADIAEYEDSVNLSSGIEAATEAGPQFFFQTVYILPTLIINLVRFRGFEELVSYKMLSIVFSFTSVAVSNYFIR